MMKNTFLVPDFVQELLDISGLGVNQIVQTLSALLSLNVLVTDPSYQVISHSFKRKEITDVVILSMKPQNAEPKSPILNCEISVDDSVENGVIVPITLNNKTFGTIAILGSNPIPEASTYGKTLLFAASLCALQMHKKFELRQERQNHKEAFLFDLLYGNIKQKVEFIEYGKIWGWDFNLPHIVIVFSLIDYNYFSNDKEIINVLFQLVEKVQIQKNNIKPIVMVKQNQIVALLPLNSSEYDESKLVIETFTETVIKRAEKIDEVVRVACGIGKIYADPVDLFRSYQEAKVAFELGLLLKIETPFFANLGLERILYKHDLQDLKEFFEHTLGRMLEYDKKTDGNLMETLEALVSNQFDMGKTSTTLFLHRNTLRYRVKKIEEILNVKLDDLNIKLDIAASLKIKLLRDI
jgi:purine catabolism regulator